jgi:DNA-binding FrmR family transcriptional regulator
VFLVETKLGVDTAQDIQDRLARIEGQVRGIAKMVAEHRSCDQILVQVMAARAALERVASAIVATGIDECLALPAAEAKKVIGNSISMLAQL